MIPATEFAQIEDLLVGENAMLVRKTRVTSTGVG